MFSTKKLIQLGAAFAVTAMATALAHARPQIDPALYPFLNGQITTQQLNRPITVIATFYSTQFIPSLSNSPVTYRAMRRALESNARQAQTRVYRDLHSTQGVRVTPLWLSNSMIIQMPAHNLAKLLNYNEIMAIIANREFKLIQPLQGSHLQFQTQQSSYTYGLEKLSVPQLRQQFPNINGSGVNVGILDTGIDANHPDLRGKTVAWKNFTSTKQGPYDDHGHGTHVAGTIAGGGGQAKVQTGLAPGAKLTVAKVFTSAGGATLEGLLKAMEWMADPDGNPETNDYPRLVSNSWGGGSPSSSADPLKDTFCMAIGNWVKLGILPVFAAGNSGSRGASSVELPGACPNAFAVGATDAQDKIAYFSSRGPARWANGIIMKPEVSAPGVDVISAKPGGGYQDMSGTSMATPHVSGLAALMIQGAPLMDVGSLSKIIIRGVTDLGAPGADNDYGYGRVNALKSLRPQTPLYP